MKANHIEELRWEKRYAILLGAFMFGVTLPCLYKMFYDPNIAFDWGFLIFTLVLRLLQWVWIFVMVVLIRFSNKTHAKLGVTEMSKKTAKSYSRQILLFMAVFILCTFPLSVSDLLNVLGELGLGIVFGDTALSIGQGSRTLVNKADVNINFLAQILPPFLGLANVLVWGISQTCLRACINCVFSCGSGDYDEDGGGGDGLIGLALPLANEASSSSGIETFLKKAEVPLSQLRLMEKVGKGGFGVVYKALYQGSAVLVKEVSVGSYRVNPQGDSSITGSASTTACITQTTLTRKSSAVQSALSEAEILVSLRHPNTGDRLPFECPRFPTHLTTIMPAFLSRVTLLNLF
jgi:hypothetical protein